MVPGVGTGKTGEAEGVAEGELAGEEIGVTSAREIEPLVTTSNAATINPAPRMNADPLGLTLSSIRRKSLYTSGRLGISRDLYLEPTSYRRGLEQVFPSPSPR